MFSQVFLLLLAQQALSEPLPLFPRQSSAQRFNTSTPWGDISTFSQCNDQCRDLTQGRFASCNNNQQADSNYFSCICTGDVGDDYQDCLECIANTQTWEPSVQSSAQALMNSYTETCRANGHRVDYETINPNTVGSSNDSLDANQRFNASTPWGEINTSNWPRCNDDCKIVYDSSEDNGFAACNSSSNYFNCVCRDDTADDYQDCLECVARNVQSGDNVRAEAQALMDSFTNGCRARGLRVDYELIEAGSGNSTSGSNGSNSNGNGNSTSNGGNSNSGTGNDNSGTGTSGNGAVAHASISLGLFVLCGVASVLAM
ncbi:hypothetical protein VNI00_007679 [Paramarasmius palmivorus]|uniref:Uncharacterized protein n=1 Tax=Paramarasmius palmivorus TaxID=297713 RepID=A0AAW0D056_9AGAR